jgi:hypothetical protein
MEMRVCLKCDKEFFPNGYQWCNNCIRPHKKKSRKEYQREWNKKNREKNRPKKREESKKYYQKHKEKIKKKMNEYYQKNQILINNTMYNLNTCDENLKSKINLLIKIREKNKLTKELLNEKQ